MSRRSRTARPPNAAAAARIVIATALVLAAGLWAVMAALDSRSSDAAVIAALRDRAQGISWRGASLAPIATAESQPALDNLEIVAQRVLGYHVTFVNGFKETTGNYGETTALDRTIIIDGTVSEAMKLAVLAHELGHVLQPPRMAREEGEVFAETVALLVCRARGLDTFEASAAYVAVFASGLRALDRQADIAWAVTVLSPN